MQSITHDEVCRNYGLRAASVLLYLQEAHQSAQNPTRAEIAQSLGVSVSTIARTQRVAKDLILSIRDNRQCIILSQTNSREEKTLENFKPKSVKTDTPKGFKSDTAISQPKVSQSPKQRGFEIQSVNSDTLQILSAKNSIPSVKSDTFSKPKESIQEGFLIANPANSEENSQKNSHILYYKESRISCRRSSDSKTLSDSNMNNFNKLISKTEKDKGEKMETETETKTTETKKDSKKPKREKTKRVAASKDELLALAKEYTLTSQEFVEVWSDFITHRSTHKHGALSLLAGKRILKKLADFEKAGFSATEALETSIVKNYSDVYCPLFSKAQQLQKTQQATANAQSATNKDALLELLNRSEKIKQWLKDKGFTIVNIMRGDEVPFRGRNGERICYTKNFRYNLYKQPITLFYVEGIDIEQYRQQPADTKLLGVSNGHLHTH